MCYIMCNKVALNFNSLKYGVMMSIMSCGEITPLQQELPV